MYQIDKAALSEAIKTNVTAALTEDLGAGDINAALISPHSYARATVISREPAVLCGVHWCNEVFRQIDTDVDVVWYANDGDRLVPNEPFVEITGKAQALLSGERVALNFLQLLSATATKTAEVVAKVTGTAVNVLDTRKTLPGLRLAQKYAVTCGGGQSHRMGLYDAFLIKENHIAACGGLTEAVLAARKLAPGKPVEVEVETLQELDMALSARADVIMLDNFSLEQTREAVIRAKGKAKIEASGGINEQTLVPIAKTGVDYISMGTLTKDVQAIDLSMRLEVIDGE
ncbi:MAG: carboxylating nicotinate-nucleotide diphosphorylase [Saccharospirillum sp.]|nr:carboxylating nicotinate-nucleotide diphosphorylase [Saccharospirillum sp.]